MSNDGDTGPMCDEALSSSPSSAHAAGCVAPHSGDTSVAMAAAAATAPDDDYLLLVRFDGKVQCINLRDGMNAWCLTSGAGNLCAYEQKSPGVPQAAAQPPSAPVAQRGEANDATASDDGKPDSPIVALQSTTQHHNVPVMLAGFRSHASCSHTYVLSGDGNLVLADDHRLLNQDILVQSLQSFNTNDSNYFEVRLRSGEVLTEGLDDAKRPYTPNGPHPPMGFEDVRHGGGGDAAASGAGPVLAIVRHNKTHTGRVRTKTGAASHKTGSPSSSTTTASSNDSVNDPLAVASAATRVWKFSSGTVSVVDLDSPSLRVLPHDGLNAGTLPLMLRGRDDSHEDLHNSGGSSFTSPTVPGSRRSYPASPSRRQPSTVEVYVDGTWHVTCGRTSVSAGHPQACWWAGTVDDSEVIKAYHYCSAFEGDEKLHEVPVGIFRDAASSTRDPFNPAATAAAAATGVASAPAGGCLEDNSDTHLYLKPESNFLFIVGEVPTSYHVRKFMDQAPTVAPCRGGKAWKVRLPRAAMPPTTPYMHAAGVTGHLRRGLPPPQQQSQRLCATNSKQAEQLVEGSRGAATGFLVSTARPMITVGPAGREAPPPPANAAPPLDATTATDVPPPSTLGSASATRASMLFLQDDSDEEEDEDEADRISLTTTADGPRRVVPDGDETRSSEATPLRHYRAAPSEHTSVTTAAGIANNHGGDPVAFFDEHFEPLRLLGQGASGVVVLCRQRVTGILYAIKMVITQSKFDEEEVLREVKLHAALMCDNVVRYHSCWTEVVTRRRAVQMRRLLLQGHGSNRHNVMTGVDSASDDDTDDLVSLASSSSATTVSSLSRNVGHKAMLLQMEYCNTTLDVRLALRRAIDRVENMAIAMQLINGVMHLHERGIVHRDIKPSNVMLLIDGDMADELCDSVLAGDLHAHARHASKVEASQQHAHHHYAQQHHASYDVAPKGGTASNDGEDDGHGSSSSSDDDGGAAPYHAPFVIKIGDLGLAKFQGESDQHPGGYFAASELHTVGVGSPIYSSPEQLQGKRCHAAGDIFSMGILLAELYLKPATVAERLDVLLKARERIFAQETLETYPELKVARAMLHPTPEKRLTLAKAKRRLRDVLATLVRL